VNEILINSSRKLPEEYAALVRDELNVKKVSYIDDASVFIDYNLKPQLKTLGPKYGKLIPGIYKALAQADGAAVMAELASGNTVTFEIDGVDVVLAEDDVLSETTQKEGYLSENSSGMTVVIDTNLTPELIEEGFVREIVSKIQTMRKDAGFEVQDHICLYAEGSDVIMKVVSDNRDMIFNEILADGSLESKDKGEYSKEWNLNGETALFSISRC
jgi:isoleucyl-tRNA synthetase